MMLIVLAVAIVLGWQANKIQDQARAVDAVQKYGGWVHYDYEFVNGTLASGRAPWAPVWLRRVLGEELFRNVRQVSLVYDNSTGKRFDNPNIQPCDELLRKLAKLPGLQELLLHGTQVTDEGLRHIGRMTDLEKLFIWDARSVTDAGIKHLSDLKKLQYIHISKSNLTDDSLALLSGLPKIEGLSLQQNHFSDEGLARLSGQDRLKRLHVGLGESRFTDAGLGHLKGFVKLETLDIQHSQVTARGLEHLKELPNLKSLWLSGTRVSQAEAQALEKATPGLRVTGSR
jgi:hypothetical protein